MAQPHTLPDCRNHLPPALRARMHAMLAVLALALVLVTNALAGDAAAMRYTYPSPETPGDRRMEHYWELLREVLEATVPDYGPYELAENPERMIIDRAVVTLGQPGSANVFVRATSREREERYRPIRVPLDKGLTGFRAFLVRESIQARLDRVRTLDELRAFSIGQSSQWIDVEILRHNGFRVETAMSYANLFPMLAGGRFDLLSRGVNEIAAELAEFRARLPGVATERTLLLYYPLPRYFFFAQTADGELLARRVEDGLQRLMRSGAFDRRYEKYKAGLLAGISLKGRRVFRLENPTLSPETPLDDKRLWDDLAREIKG